MVQFNNSTIQIKAKGSPKLLSGLQIGDLKMIATHFGYTYTTVRGVIVGKHHGDKDIVECAERIVAFYKSVKLSESVKSIIHSYEKSN